MPILNGVPDDKTTVLLIIGGVAALIVWDYHRRTCPYKTGGIRARGY